MASKRHFYEILINGGSKRGESFCCSYDRVKDFMIRIGVQKIKASFSMTVLKDHSALIEEQRIFRNGLEEFHAPLGRNDVLSVWMLMNGCPLLEAEQRVLVFQHQVVSNGKNLLIVIRKAGLQICCDTGFLSDLVKQIGCAEEKTFGLNCRDRTFPDNGIRLLLCTAFSMSVRRNNRSCSSVQTANQCPLGSGLLLLFVPVGDRFINVSDTTALVQLLDRFHSDHPPANHCYVLQHITMIYKRNSANNQRKSTSLRHRCQNFIVLCCGNAGFIAVMIRVGLLFQVVAKTLQYYARS